MSRIQVLVTGSRFTGRGFRAVEPVIEELVLSAKREIQIAAYLFTPASLPFLKLVESLLEKGVRVTIIVNRLHEQAGIIRNFFSYLKSRFPYFKIRDFTNSGENLHAKVIVVDRKKAVVGSANFSWGGMVANHEICLLVEGAEASRIADLLDLLSQ